MSTDDTRSEHHGAMPFSHSRDVSHGLCPNWAKSRRKKYGIKKGKIEEVYERIGEDKNGQRNKVKS